MAKSGMARLLTPAAVVLVAVSAASCTIKSASPAADNRGTVVRVTVTPAGCAPEPARVPAGPVSVIADNLDAPTVSEVEIRTEDMSRVMGEKENLVEGMSAEFTASLTPGRYIVNCPGASRPHWTLSAATRAASSSH